MAHLTRRHFIAAAAVTGAAVLWAMRPDTSSIAESPPAQTFAPELEAFRKELHSALPFLILPRATVDRFLAALSEAKYVPGRANRRLQLFLLSTDFFAHGADESRPLQYVQLYDPYRSPCYNPMVPAA